MSQCLSWKQMRRLLGSGGGGPLAGRGLIKRRSLGGGAAATAPPPRPGWCSSWLGQDLAEAARAFRVQCLAAARDAEAGEEALPLVEAAAQLVESILGGMHEQLRGVRVDAEVRAPQPGAGPGRPDGAGEELAVLEARLGAPAAPLVGEIATRSRVAVNVQVSGGLRFALLRPARPREQPVALRVDGLDMPTLPDCVCARTQLREELGLGLNPATAYEWWERNRHTRFPLQTSKFHRVVESLLEQRGMKVLGAQIRANSFWGYLHTTDLNIEVFNFHSDRRVPGGVTMTAQLRPPKTPAEAADREQVKVITKKMLLGNRASADKLAPSGINVGAMIAGPEVGQPGAHPRVVSKLLSAAQWWGPGEDGWHRFDETWLCTDRKDLLGRVVQQQGRIIWRERGSAEDRTRWGDRAPAADLRAPSDGPDETAAAPDGPRICLLVALLLLLCYTVYFSR